MWRLAWSLVPVCITSGMQMLTHLIGPPKPVMGFILVWMGLIGLWFGITDVHHRLRDPGRGPTLKG
jgi:hypothetical protein